MSANSQFAFGGNEIGDCVCPAVATGRYPDATGERHVPGLLEAAEQYDAIVQDMTDDYSGVVDSGVAEDAWNQMIEKFVEGDRYEVTAAIEVAEDLGWAEEGDYEL